MAEMSERRYALTPHAELTSAQLTELWRCVGLIVTEDIYNACSPNLQFRFTPFSPPGEDRQTRATDG
jgi:hypothetical protein